MSLRGGQEGALGASARPTYMKPICNGLRGASEGPPLRGAARDRHTQRHSEGAHGGDGHTTRPATRRTDPRVNTCGQRHDVLLPAAGSGVATSDPAHVRPRRAQASAGGPAGPSVDAGTVARRSSAAHVRQMLEGLSNGVTSKPQARKPGDREKKTKARVGSPGLEPAYTCIGQKSDAVPTDLRPIASVASWI